METLIGDDLSNNDVISCLWNKNATEKCRIGLADAVIYENGTPVRWYVTGKAGEVTKKRGSDLLSISQRWLKIYSQNESATVAIVRQEGGVIKFLPLEAWESFIEDTSPDTSISSLHCFINGDNHCVYRNSFDVKDKLGRFSSQTQSYCFKLDKNNPSTVVTMFESQLSLAESKAVQIRNILDLATSTVVRYLELMLKVKVVSISLDFVIDRKSQVWLMWATNTRVVRRSEFADVSILPQNISDDKMGRMSWAGPKYAEELTNNITGGPQNRTSRRPKLVSESFSQIHSPTKELTATQVNLAATISQSSGCAVYSVHNSENSGNVDQTQKFPQPFKCKGDYCSFHVQLNSKSLHINAPSERQSMQSSSKLLFSDKELDRLGGEELLKQKLSLISLASPHAVLMIAMKSILLARQERRGLSATVDSLQVLSAYPTSPRSKLGGNITDDMLSGNHNATETQQVWQLFFPQLCVVQPFMTEIGRSTFQG